MMMAQGKGAGYQLPGAVQLLLVVRELRATVQDFQAAVRSRRNPQAGVAQGQIVRVQPAGIGQ
jgi:hypothetical protein